jgi:hypothetical protein
MAKQKYKFGGVANVIDPAEAGERRDRFAPYTEMVEGSNVDLTDRMAVRRRPGRLVVNPLASHSLWATGDGEQAFFVNNLGLYRLNTDYSQTLLAVLSNNAPVVFQEINGPNVIVYSNGTDKGCLVAGVASSPPATSKVGRIPTRSGVCLTFHNGHLLSGNNDGVIYYSDPYDIDWMEEDNCRIPMAGLPTMVRSIDTGVWASTADKLVYLGGESPADFTYKWHKNYGAIPGASMVVDTKKLRMELPGKKAVVWASANGVCVGTATGELINLSETKYSYAPGQRGAIMLRETDGMAQIVVAMTAVGSKYNKDSTSITPVRHRLN